MSERVLPGVSVVEVTEGLTGIPAVGLVAAKLVGTACKGPLTAQFFGPSEVQKFVNMYGPADPYQYSLSTTTNPPMELTLVRAGRMLFGSAPPGGIWICRAADSGVETAVGNAVTSGTEGNIRFTAKEAGAWYNNFEYKHILNENVLGESVTESNTFWLYVPSYDFFDSSVDATKETARISANIFQSREVGFEYNAQTSGSTATPADFISQWTGSNNTLLNALFDVVSIDTVAATIDEQTTYTSIFAESDTGGSNWSGGTQPDQSVYSTSDSGNALELLRNKEARLTLIAGASEATNQTGQIAIGQAHVGVSSQEDIEQLYICGVDNYASQDTMVAAILTDGQLNLADARVIKVAPGIITANPYLGKGNTTAWAISTINSDTELILSGGYAASIVAGIVAQQVPDQSPMNKSAPISGLEFEFTLTNKKQLVRDEFFLLVSDNGHRTLLDLTTAGAGDAFEHVSTRMAVDDIKRAVRLAGQPFIGKKNNTRIRSIMKRNLEEVLRGYVKREIINPEWSLVTESSRVEQILGVVTITFIIQVVFYIKFIEVTMVLE